MKACVRSGLLVLSAIVIVAAPLILPGIGGQFKGTDDQAAEAIEAASPGYKPWFSPVWQPPSSEIESLLFAVQAAIGAGILGYVIGRKHGAVSRDAGS